MSKQIPRKNHNNGLKPSLPPLPNPLMTQNQLIDSLTAHISLYHSRSLPPNPNPNPSPRSSILKWFSSLSVHQRQCHLTVVDHKFTQLLLQMLAKIHSHGHGRFIILPDLPSHDLPGLCFKKSRGLLSRTAQSNQSERLIFESARLFYSKEGENIAESSCSVKCLDSMTVAEELVRNVETFVAAMDELSNGGFLRGEENELGADWLELEWLKARGYYSAEAFVANRLEVALRLAWLNCNGGKKRGVKLKEKVAGAGVMANVFWRKKGCVEWWENLDAGSRKKVWNAVLGKAAKSLTREVLREASSSMEDGMQLCRAGEENPLRYIYTESSQRAVVKQPAGAEFSPVITPSPFSGKVASSDNVFNSLLVLQDIFSLLLPDWHSKYSLSKVFFSSLDTVNTISDCILRKLRGLFMVISLDCTRIELLGEGNFKSLPNKSKAKPSSGGSRRKKAKTHNMKKLNPVPAMSVDETPIHEPVKDLECGSGQAKKTKLTGSNEIPSIPHRSESCRGISSSPVEMEHSQGMALEKVRTATRKNKKGKKKKKNSSFNIPVEARESEQTAAEVPCFSVLPSDEPAEASEPSDNMMHDGELIGIVSLALNTTLSNSPIEPAREDMDEQGIHELGADCMKSICHSVSDYQPPNGLTENQTVPSRIEFSNREVSHVPTAEFTVSCTDDINIHNNRNEGKSVYVDRSRRCLGVKEEPSMAEGKKSGKICGGVSSSSSECLSYEWPSLAPVYFSSINPHIPPATDRLHLDVGRNWHNHIRQPFVPTVHQARNSPIENGCNRVLSRPLPMSLDWPPAVRSPCGIVPSMTCNYDSGFISRRQSAFQQNFSSQNMQFYTKTVDDERKYSGDNADFPEATNSQELMDECESHWMSEEEMEVHALSGRDYNQYFGGGVMYWNPSDHMGGGFSRAPSLSSDDSSWAWHEADLNRAVDDMVAFSSPYSANGLTSPTAASFCSAFDPLVPGNQALGYVVSGNDVPCKVMHSSASATDAASEQEVSGSLTSLSGDVEGKMGDTLPYPILPPIIIPSMSRERSRSDFRRSHDHKSPCIPPTRREHPRIKRPPSPVVLCVPRAPRPPPPSPVSDSRKHRGVPTVRSGSSSPRHWGMRGSYNDGNSLEEGCMRMDGIEVVWPSWRNKNLPAHPMIQPLPGALLQDRLIAISQLARDQEHPDVSFPLQSPELQNSPTRRASLSLMHSLLQDEIDLFCKQVAAATTARKPFINWTVKRVTRSLQVLWPRSRTSIFGSNATGMSLPTSDVDLVVCLPPVRNLEPIKEAGILEGRNGIKETCLQHAARYLANQEWVKNDSLKTVENTAIPIIMLVVEVPGDLINSIASNVQSPKEEPARMTGEDNHVLSDVVGSEDSSSPKCSRKKDVKSIRLDISFKSPSHTGHQTTKLVKELTEQFPAVTPLALVLKKFLADRSLDQSYSGGLSSYCLVTCAHLISISPTEWGVADLEFLAFRTHPAASFLAIDAIFQHDLSVLLITRFLQHQHHHGRPINQNLGSLLMDFLYFFGNVFDPRQMRVSVQGSGVYINRERGHSIDPVHIDDPLFPTNNVGRNCFRIHQCIKAFSEAYSILENELTCLPDEGDAVSSPPYRLLPKIIASINILQES